MNAGHGGRTLAVPALSGRDLVSSIRGELAARAFDARVMLIEPAESRLYPERALRLRLSVLMRTYGDDYHTDSFDLARLTAQVRDGDEAIWFWGSPTEIERARAQLRLPPGAPAADLPIGTVTVLSAETEFGPGHGELCRSGSMDRSTGAVAAILHRMAGYHSGADAPVHDRYHTLLLAARNRASAPSIRGGEAVQHIHCHYVQSRFWGLVPFYVMRGGVIECTELRESNRDPDDVRSALAAPVPWLFADPRDGEYARALCRLNFGTPASIATLAVKRVSPVPTRLLMPPHPSLFPANHATVKPATTAAPGLAGFPEAVRQAEDSGVCCVAVHLRLDDPQQVNNQAWLAGRGYVLTAVSPPKRTWQLRGGQRELISAAAIGIWCRARPDLPVVAPYYLQHDGADEAERAVLSHLRDRFGELHARHA